MDRSLVSLGNTAPRALDLARLRSDLSALWREEGRGVSRACHATLVVVVAQGEDPEPLLDDLVLTHPSRVLRIEHDPKLPAGEVVAWASGNCMRRPSGTLVCSETIHFMVGENADSRLPSVIRSLAVGGVPLVVISREISPLELPWVEELGEDADLIVGRSAGLPSDDAAEVWRAWKLGHEPPVQDLTWQELDPWRRVIQNRFDHSREISRLNKLSEVKLLGGSAPGRWLEKALLTGWLGSRLGWTKLRAHERFRFSVQRPGGETAIVFEGDQESSLKRVTFSFEGGEDPLLWSAEDLPFETPSAPLSRVLHSHELDPVARAACGFALQVLDAREGWETKVRLGS